MSVYETLVSTKIGCAQIDPNGICPAKCWYCPNRYTSIPQEERTHMSPELFEKIIADIHEEKNRPDGLVNPSFDFIYTAHYNEITMYAFLPYILPILRKYKFKTMILSNGIPLTEEKVDLLAEYPDVVIGTCLDVPAFEEATWISHVFPEAKLTKVLFEFTMDNIRYASSKLNNFSIQVNGMDAAEVYRQVSIAKNMFPGVSVFPAVGLSDRAGILHEQGVISNREEIERNKAGKTSVVGCRNSFQGVAGRPYGWLHVSPAGNAFLCCNDYYMEYSFGNFEDQSLREIWLSDLHVDMIESAFSNICENCSMAVWE